ncbi:MAG TPA: nucleotidyltransferase [Rhodocyclaceae bacterium]|nr:MAG: nucleotidyltransferase [Betaproteobacteria bacterium CG2_30_68_42]HCX34540.1 nucleotidyltransferase [Rhodocyclaceae bacterium]
MIQETGIPQGPYQSMYSPLSTIVRRAPVTVGPQAGVREALAAMDAEGVGSVIVVLEPGHVPIGIFTLPDLLRRVALKGCHLDTPVVDVMTSGLVTLRPDASAYQAAVAMARHGIRHVLVVDGEGALVGIVSQNDLFALQRVGAKEISEQIRHAGDMAALEHASRDIASLAHNMLIQGAGAEPLTQFVSTLNDLLTLSVIELTMAEFRLPVVKWCWIALGSEGRLEQTLSTDQDNGIIFEAPSAAEAPALREAFVAFAREVNARLDRCGFPLCKGNIMAGNPQWCLSLEEWRHTFSQWMGRAEPQALLNAAIFFDFRPLYGDEELSEGLREWLLGRTGGNPLFLRQMAENALQCQPPLGLIRDFVFDSNPGFPHTIDLKMYGSRPFVDAARIFALANGVAETGTVQRLRAVASRMSFGRDDVAAIIDGFHFILMLRLRQQHRVRGGEGAPNRVDPDELNELERYILKEAFRQAKKLQSRLQLDYRL